MSRRRTTLSLSVLLLVALVVVAALLHVPYVILAPGPVTDTLGQVPSGLLAHGQPPTPVIAITGRTTQPTSGHLYLTTVSVQPGDCDRHPSLYAAVKAWFSRSEAVYPYQLQCPPGKSAQTVRAEDEQQMAQSQSDAVTAALLELGYTPTERHVSLSDDSVSPSAPAASVLRTADVILDVDGTPVSTIDDIRTAVQKHSVGSSISLTVRRDGKPLTVTTTTIAGTDGSAALGIGDPDQVASFAGIAVKIGIDPQVVGGPSAGTALALGIIDKLTPGGLTGGRTIAGTGTVNGYGVVGPIGGIQQKIAAAEAQHASVFFAPASECPDAKSAASRSLTLVKVDTLHTAVTALKAIEAGSSAFPHC